MRYNMEEIARVAGLSSRSVRGVLGIKPYSASREVLEKISSAITKLYYPVTADDLRVGVGVSSNPFLVGIRQQRRSRRCALELKSFVNGLYNHLPSL